MWGKYTKMQKKTLSADAKKYISDYSFPLSAAAHNKNIDVFRELVEYDPKSIEAVDEFNAPILYTVFTLRNIEMAEILLDNRADSNVFLSSHIPPRTLLMQAVVTAQMEFIELLITKGASVDFDVKGMSVREILKQPELYVKKLFKDMCPGALKFLEKAPEMKELVDRLSPPQTATLSSISSSIEKIGIRQRFPAEKPTTPPPAVLVH